MGRHEPIEIFRLPVRRRAGSRSTLETIWAPSRAYTSFASGNRKPRQCARSLRTDIGRSRPIPGGVFLIGCQGGDQGRVLRGPNVACIRPTPERARPNPNPNQSPGGDVYSVSIARDLRRDAEAVAGQTKRDRLTKPQRSDRANSRLADNMNPKRSPYELLTHSCMHFLKDTAIAGGAAMPMVIDPRPAGYIDRVRDDFRDLDFSPPSALSIEGIILK